jgi:fatty-acyl-CoA synthase
VWDKFKERFGIPRILEFYAATEGGVSLFNAEGKRGAIGRIPAYLTHRFAPALIKLDIEKNNPLRDERGFCIRCGQNEPGEAVGRLSSDPSGIGGRYEGYTDDAASDKKILRDVFEPGDMWVRTGDLMRKDEKGFFYFVDRIGDTFRWKGENVATSEVAEAICAFAGVKHAIVYGVTVPGADGRAGMAAIATDVELDLPALWRHLSYRLPAYARPVFLRFRNDIDVTGTFKYSRTELVRVGYDPVAAGDTIYFGNPEMQTFTRVDDELYVRIQAGLTRI